MARRGSPDDLPAALRRALLPATRPGLVGALWNWRWEGGLALGLPTAGLQLDNVLVAGSSLATAVVGVVALVVSPTVRGWVRSRVRAVVVQHRLRVGFVEAGLFSSQGNLPFLCWTTPDRCGERVYAWLPAGVTAGQLIAAAPILAVATWATTVEVTSHHRGRAHLVVIHIRRTEES